MLDAAARAPGREKAVLEADAMMAAQAAQAEAKATATATRTAELDQRLSAAVEKLVATSTRASAATAELAAAEREAAAARSALLHVLDGAGSPTSSEGDGIQLPKLLVQQVAQLSEAVRQRATKWNVVLENSRMLNQEAQHLDKNIEQIVRNSKQNIRQEVDAAKHAAARAAVNAEAAARRVSALKDGAVCMTVDVDAANIRGETPLFVACVFIREIPRESTKHAVLSCLSRNELADVCMRNKCSVVEAQQQGEELPSQSKLLAAALTLDLDDDDLCRLRNAKQDRLWQTRTVEMLLNAGANPNIVAHNGVSALFMACQRGAVTAARALVAAGADVQVRPQPAGLTLLYIAAYGGHLEIVQMLLEDPEVDINDQTDQHKLTALMPAAQEGHLEVVKYLHARGADPNIRNDEEGTALLFAAKYNRLEIAKYLLNEMRADCNPPAGVIAPIYTACEKGWAEMAELLLSEGADINAVKANGASSLLVAVEQGHQAVVNVLLKHGADTGAALNACGSDAIII
eukprot:SAG31_NODE_7078_length_1794_cov_7.903856_1_plen_517_part_01